MEKRKKWQSYLIVAIICLTLYNIFPTVFFYAKPLKSSIDEKRSFSIAESIATRVNTLEEESIKWLSSYCDLLKLKPLSIALHPTDPLLVNVTFKSVEEANLFKQHLPRAGALISFAPAALSLHDPRDTANKTVVVQRKIPLHFNKNQLADYFQFSLKFDTQGNPTPLYRALVEDRLLQVAVSLGGPSENGERVQAAINKNSGVEAQEQLITLSQNILSFVKTYGEHSSITKRYFASFTQIVSQDRGGVVQSFIQALFDLKEKIKSDKVALQEQSSRLKNQGLFLSTVEQQNLELLSGREKLLDQALTIIRRNNSYFAQGKTPLSYDTFAPLLSQSAGQKMQLVSLQECNPFVEKLAIDWVGEQIEILLYPDVVAFQNLTKTNPTLAAHADQLLYDAMAQAARQTSETITPVQDRFKISLSQLTHSKSFLAIRLSAIAAAQVKQLKETLKKNWNPLHPDLKEELFPIVDYETYENLIPDQQKLALVIYAPALYKKSPPSGLHMNTVYVIGKGMDKIAQRIRSQQESIQSQQFVQDFQRLKEILQNNGFLGYSGKLYGLSSEFANDFIFEGKDYYQTLLSATREDFSVHGSQRFAVLEFSDLEQRILTENKIANHIHEDLLKWRDDYHAAQLAIRGISYFDVPKPVHNVYWDNFKLSFVKYFRGDERKILHWGLDLSGGKTVQIELQDNNHRIVTNEADLRQAVNELYARVNKMGISEVTIRQEGKTITLDFPGSQHLSAAQLVKASSMQFHVVNEKFGIFNPLLSEAVSSFLQGVWNEALITNRKEADDLQRIAWKHLYGNSLDTDVTEPRSDEARLLIDNGFKLAHPDEANVTTAFNETYSTIARYPGDDFTQWHGQTHPLLIVFKNRALEGADLSQVQSSYDPSKGNFLSFSVKGSSNKEGVSPQNALFAWTSQFSKEKIAGTPLEAYSRGNGWRMAVILNGSVISAPTLDASLKDSATISGSFTQREINQLEADLKAGSLSFTPRILSEMNVSPELGSKEKISGIIATIFSLSLVIAAMMIYYRFGGVIASIAVLFNLLILWATLQNLQASMTLAGIAAIILTLGMAVDANVLVFERIREELAVTTRLSAAINAGYRKAFTAILDSNVTTIIAALVLLQFNSGPIKGFATTLIIGIISSMITALFMTRFFFAGWLQNPQHKTLNMRNWFKAQSFDFLKYVKPALFLSVLIILIGACLFVYQKSSLFGMDFKGGYALTVDLPLQPQTPYRPKVEEALRIGGAGSQDLQVRELTPSNRIRIFLSRNLEQSGKPFFGMPRRYDLKENAYLYQNNPKIVWIVDSLQRAGIVLSPTALSHLDQSWTEVSGQMSDTMRTSAIVGLSIALLAILIYITLRFEFKYAMSATICIVHDVLFTVSFIAILHALKVPLQIDLNTVAALLTIVGYSLNDTIIVFDRIREDVRVMRKDSYVQVINHALNITLSRTIMTSGTTLLVLVPLIFMGGSTLFGFALVMAIGVIFGTLSSLFIAAPLLKYFHDKEEMKIARSAT